MKPVLKSDIANKSFYPIPKIELSLIKIVPKDIINPFLSNNDSIDFFLMFIAGIMPYKNKNIVNAVEFFLKSRNNNQYTKDRILKILLRYNLENEKVFQFSIDELIEISKIFYI